MSSTTTYTELTAPLPNSEVPGVDAEFVSALRALAKAKDGGYYSSAIVVDYTVARGYSVTIHESLRPPKGCDDSSYLTRRTTTVARGTTANYAQSGLATFGSRLVAQNPHSAYAGHLTLVGNLARNLKVGDILAVEFLLNNSTGALDAAGLVRDECYVTIVRNNNKAVARFLVDFYVGPRNTASMIDTWSVTR